MDADFDSIKCVDWETFRHDLAFSAMDSSGEDADANAAAQDFLIDICAILPKFYGEELDRMRLWDRIGSALDILASKLCDNEEIADILIAHVCGDFSVASADSTLNDLIKKSSKISVASIKHVISRKKLFIICKAREGWVSRFTKE